MPIESGQCSVPTALGTGDLRPRLDATVFSPSRPRWHPSTAALQCWAPLPTKNTPVCWMVWSQMDGGRTQSNCGSLPWRQAFALLLAFQGFMWHYCAYLIRSLGPRTPFPSVCTSTALIAHRISVHRWACAPQPRLPIISAHCLHTVRCPLLPICADLCAKLFVFFCFSWCAVLHTPIMPQLPCVFTVVRCAGRQLKGRNKGRRGCRSMGTYIGRRIASAAHAPGPWPDHGHKTHPSVLLK